MGEEFNLLDDLNARAQLFGVSVEIRNFQCVVLDEQGELYSSPLFEQVCAFFDMAELSGMKVRAFIERQNEINAQQRKEATIGKRRTKRSYKR